MAFDFPASPTEGQTFTPPGGPTYVYNAPVWKTIGTPAAYAVTASDTPPANPIPNQMWWESDTGNLFIWYVDPDTSQWVQVNVATTTQGTASTKNLIVNPALQVTQETAFGANVSVSGNYIVDQWFCAFSGPVGGTNVYFSATNITNPVPFVQMVVAGNTTPYPTVGAGEHCGIAQFIEGQMFASDLNWGTTNAVPGVLSFDAYCTMAGTYSASIRSSNSDRSIVFPITFAAGETSIWKRFTFAVPAITTGTFPRDSTKGLELRFNVMVGASIQAPTSGLWQSASYIGVAGQSNLFATASQAFYVRRIGLYADPNGAGLAPPFVVPNYDDELRRCQRYYAKTFSAGVTPAQGVGANGALLATSYSAGGAGSTWFLPVNMRTAPTVTSYNPADATSTWRDVTNSLDRTFSLGVAATGSISANASGTAATAAYNYVHMVANARM